MTSLLIGTPTYRSSVYIGYTVSLLNCAMALNAKGIPFGIETTDSSDIAGQRNYMASFFLRDARFTHLLFIDSDMTFKPSAVLRMIEANEPMIGCVYPTRELDLRAAVSFARQNDGRPLIAASQKFVFTPIDSQISTSNGIMSVASIGMGLMLIRRDALERMTKIGLHETPHPTHRYDNFKNPIFGFFDPFPGKTEDVSFCERWRDLCGGRICAIIDEPLGHFGQIEVQARYSDKFVV